MIFMAHRSGKKTAGISRDARAKRLGVKLFAGQKAKIGSILVRQRGTKFLPGKNVARAKDDSLYAVKQGTVSFKTKRILGFNNRKRKKKIVEVN